MNCNRGKEVNCSEEDNDKIDFNHYIDLSISDVNAL